jgi:hypothetical protein
VRHGRLSSRTSKPWFGGHERVYRKKKHKPVLVANIGIPMVFVTVATMLLALLPIALAEAWVLSRMCGLIFSEAFKGAYNANLWSTILGIPLAWFALVVAQMASGAGTAWGLETPLNRLAAVTLQSPWLVPYTEDLGWMIPAASLTLLIPFFGVSVFVEHRILKKRWIASPKNLRIGVFYANVVSYLMLAAYYAGTLWKAWG